MTSYKNNTNHFCSLAPVKINLILSAYHLPQLYNITVHIICPVHNDRDVFRGKAEIARLIFAQAGVEYEDVRINRDEWCEHLKQKAPFGHIPVLSVNGTEVCGSINIAHFIAEKHGLAGDNDLQNAEIGSIVDFIMDIRKPCENIIRETKKKSATAEVIGKTLPNMLKTLENVIQPNFTAHGFVYGSKVTWADICIYLLSDNLSEHFKFKILADDFPCLAKLHTAVANLPNIKKWIETRPT